MHLSNECMTEMKCSKNTVESSIRIEIKSREYHGKYCIKIIKQDCIGNKKMT